MTLRERTQELLDKRAKVREMGGAERVRRQHERGKLTARERIDVLMDAGSFQEFGQLASEWHEPWVNADGVITGFGLVDGRTVCVAAYDFTTFGGSIGPMGEKKVT